MRKLPTYVFFSNGKVVNIIAGVVHKDEIRCNLFILLKISGRLGWNPQICPGGKADETEG